MDAGPGIIARARVVLCTLLFGASAASVQGVVVAPPMVATDASAVVWSSFDPYPRRIGVDIERYRFELTLSDSTDIVRGEATVSVRFTGNGVTELLLDLAERRADGTGMTVRAVRSSDGALAFTHADDVLRITLSEPGRVGARVDVTVEYDGLPAAGLRIGPNKYGDRTFFSDNWPNRARQWLPTIDHPYDKAGVDFVVHAPARYQVVSNGVLVEESDGPAGLRRSHWHQEAPIATWLYVLGVARFAVQQVDDFRGRPIQTWVYPQDREAGFHDFAVPTKQVMEFYADRVGPYAYAKLANVTSPATPGGMEAATAIMYSESAVDGLRSERWRNVIIHEVAHQWFGNAVTESDWDDVWLSEGFATYFTLLFIEHAYGRDAFVQGLRQSAERVFAQYDQDPGYRVVHDDLADMARVTSGATYQKGSWVLHMLRSRLGDETFWAGIRAYYARYMNANASTEDFRRTMEEVSGSDLSGFFDQWLRNGGNPNIEGWWDYDPTAQALRIELNQVQDVGPTFGIPLEIAIRYEGESGTDSIETVDVTDRFHRFVIPVPREPASVTLDPSTRVLMRQRFGPRGGRP